MSRHMLPHFHWCAGCCKWVCLCQHCVEPLDFPRRAVDDLWIRSLGYDRRRGRLEIEFTWKADVRVFYPVAPAVYRQLLAANPMYLFLNARIMKTAIRSAYVRTGAKRVVMMARPLKDC
jgi:hypothetical protein